VHTAVVAGGLSGCANFWDDVTSRDHKFGDMFRKQPDPREVLEKSTDGDKRARALRSLQEPLAHGGTQQDQDATVELLVRTATRDPQVWCRQAAIDTLRHFHDPRAVEALKSAYYTADAFPPEASGPLRCQILAALGDTGNPSAVELLVKVVRQPPAAGPEIEKQQTTDERIAAARALGHFPEAQSTEALVTVLRTEQDHALRDRSCEALVKITGKDLPPDAQAWEDYLHHGTTKESPGSGLRDGFLRLISGTSSEAPPPETVKQPGTSSEAAPPDTVKQP
jgi:HEAT repeat protein